MYAPRAVWTDGERIVVADTGNHRVLIWHTWPSEDGAPADVVVGQPSLHREGPAAGEGDTVRGLNLPTGVALVDGDLVVADAWHHRLLAYDDLPTDDFATPTRVLGQADLHDVAPNRGGDPSADSFYWPFGFAVVAGTFWVADTGNRRVLGWPGASFPEKGRAAEIVLGQDSGDGRADNRGEPHGPASFRWPHGITGDDGVLYVADAGDHRVLGWSPPPTDDGRATVVIGQQDFASGEEFKNRAQGAQRLRFPYAVAMRGDQLVVADTSNNRVLLWDAAPRTGAGALADHVLAQPDMDANGENRWDAVLPDSLCWPYGLSVAGDVLAVADSGNNRVMLWRLG
jgi:hypothetical protein